MLVRLYLAMILIAMTITKYLELKLYFVRIILIFLSGTNDLMLYYTSI